MNISDKLISSKQLDDIFDKSRGMTEESAVFTFESKNFLWKCVPADFPSTSKTASFVF
jgi:hypothetical protein